MTPTPLDLLGRAVADRDFAPGAWDAGDDPFRDVFRRSAAITLTLAVALGLVIPAAPIFVKDTADD